MEVGFIEGSILALVILCVGIIGLLVSKHKREKNKWAWQQLYLVPVHL
ncbi:MAG: hypothetical protein ACREV6_16070 [Clostridium sp.]